MWNVLFEEQHLRLVIDWQQVFQVRKPKQRHLCFSRLILISYISLFLFDLVFRTTVTLRNEYCHFFFSKWVPPEIGIGRVLRVVEFLVHFRMRCWCSTVSACLRLNDHISNLFITIAINICLKWSNVSVLLVLPPDTTQNNPTSIIHHLQSCHFLWFFILCATEFQGAYLPCSHVNLIVFFRHSAYLKDKEKIELCGVAHAFVQISENGPR